jgi:hypothetical protein
MRKMLNLARAASAIFLVSAILLVACAQANESKKKWTLGQIDDPPADAVPCPALSKEHLAKYAVNNVVLVTVVDKLIMQKFGKSWVKNVEQAGIKYWWAP